MRSRREIVVGAAIASCALVACVSPGSRSPEIARIYERAAVEEIRNPVVVIHGILGARLAQRSTGKVVWGAFTRDAIDPETADGARAIALPLEVPASAFAHDPARADVYATGPLERLELSILYQLVSVEVYANIIRALGAGGYDDSVVASQPKYAEDHYSCFTYFYDWRRDNVESAIRLGEFLAETRREVERGSIAKIARLRAAGRERKADELQAWLDRGVRFDIVAHSMGGLIARYYLRFGAVDLPADGSVPDVTWAGAADIDRLVLVGTPNLGSLDALRNLYEGYSPSWILPYFDPVLLGTMPALYQLLPRVRHRVLIDESGQPYELDFMDPAVWREQRWGLASERADTLLRDLLPEVSDAAERARIADRYLRWCLARAAQFHAALDLQPGSQPSTMRHLFAADAESTLARAVVWSDAHTGRLRLGFDSAYGFEPGDRTVPRYSALADERFSQPEASAWLRSPIEWHNVTFLSDDHVGLTRNVSFVNNLLFLLLEQRPHDRSR